MNFPAASLFLLCLTFVSSTVVGEKQHAIRQDTTRSGLGHLQKQQLLRQRNNKECPDGLTGTNCNENVDECQGLPYPCAGGIQKGSFCIDHSPPEMFECGCLDGYVAVLPDNSSSSTNGDVKDSGVPVEWRPLECIPIDAMCIDFVCHEEATCVVSSSNKAVCICNDNLVGDGVTNCSLPSPGAETAVLLPTDKNELTAPPSPTPCDFDLDCHGIENSVCMDGTCQCKIGFSLYTTTGRGHGFLMEDRSPKCV